MKKSGIKGRREGAEFLDRENLLTNLVEIVKQDNEVIAVLLFGSIAQGRADRESDIDICLVMQPGFYAPLELSRKKLAYLKLFDLDIQIFQQLPLYIRMRVIKENRVLFCRNEGGLYKIAFSTITEFSDFEHIYRDYLKDAVRC
jgi:predicted nucleotidyltransferase